ncbi:MAG: ATP-grasp domain-containing protein [Nanoarchaeota archaeon]
MIESYHQDWEGRNTNDDAHSVVKALNKLGHEVSTYYVDLDMFEKLKNDRENIDLVFNLCDDGFFSKSKLEPHVAAMLDILQLPYTGGKYLTLSITLRKDTVKKILTYHNLPTPKFKVLKSARENIKNMKYPLIVKPLREDASIGIKDESVVHNEKDLRKQVQNVIKEYKQPALVEEFISGREFNVGFIGKEMLPISEITFDGLPPEKPKIINYDAKWKEDSVDYEETKRSCPAKVNIKLGETLKNLATEAAKLFDCKDYYRIDFRVDKDNNPFILEINQNPDLSEDAGLTAMAQVKGYSYAQMIDMIVRNALNDNKKQA